MSPLPPHKATLQAVANLAKVSYSTVSLILNGRGKEFRLQSSTCSKVLDAARELGYEANYFARGLHGKPTRTIGILWNFKGSQGEDNIIRQMTEKVLDRGYIAHFFDPLGDRAILLSLLKELTRRSVDGIILQTAGFPLLENADISPLAKLFNACVLISQNESIAGTDVIYHTRTKAIRNAIGHLVESGRKRLAMIGSRHCKFELVRQAWLSHGRAEQDITMLRIDCHWKQNPATAMQELFKTLPWGGRNGIDSLLCNTDEAAFIAIHHLNTIGLSVPADIAVIGFNNSEAGQSFHPPLASISRNDRLIADKAIEYLFARLSEPDLAPQKSMIEMDFVLRQSALQFSPTPCNHPHL